MLTEWDTSPGKMDSKWKKDEKGPLEKRNYIFGSHDFLVNLSVPYSTLECAYMLFVSFCSSWDQTSDVSCCSWSHQMWHAFLWLDNRTSHWEKGAVTSLAGEGWPECTVLLCWTWRGQGVHLAVTVWIAFPGVLVDFVDDFNATSLLTLLGSLKLFDRQAHVEKFSEMF